MNKPNILFLCTGNSCRSQMAEAWAKKYWGHEFNIYSAGNQKHGMNARAKQVMHEAGVDMKEQYSKTVDELSGIDFDVVVTVCGSAQENCPYFPAAKVVHVGFQDPPSITKNMQNEESILAVYRQVRDEIHTFIKDMKKVLEIL